MAHANPDYVRYSSWGRTRSPKNILSSNRSGVDSSGTPKELTAAADPIVVDTENQRYLHVWVTDDGDGDAGRLKVHGHAWAASHDNGANDGVLDTFHDIPLTSTGNVDMSTNGVAVGYYLIEIGGIDKIKFDAANATVKFYAACSTFSMS
jgi:hypothetical protein